MERGLGAEDGLEVVDRHRRDGMRVEGAEPLAERRRAAEGPLHRDLLVEQHPDEERERVGDEERVGVGVAGDREDRSRHGSEPTDDGVGAGGGDVRRRPARH